MEQWVLILLQDTDTFPRCGIFTRAYRGQAGMWLLRNV